MSKTTDGPTPSQRAALERLAERGVLGPDQLSAVLGALESSPAARRSATSGLWEVLGYVGGALVLGGAALLLGMSWDDLARSARVGLLIAATVVLLGAGTLIGGGPRGVRSLSDATPSPRSRIVAVLYALGSGTSAMAVGSALDSFEAIAATAAGLLVAVLGYVVLPSVPALVAMGGFSVGVVSTGAEQWFSSSTVSLTVGLIVLGVIWSALAATGRLVDEAIGLAGGSAIALAGAQWPISSEQPWWAYAATVLIALACFVGYLWRRVSVLVAFGVLGITVAVPEAIWDWTDGALSAPLTVLIVGLVFLAAGGMGLRLRKTHSRDDAHASGASVDS